MPRAKRAPLTKTETPAKPAAFVAEKKKNGNGNGDAVLDVESAIRARAYELYERRGRRDGFALDDWFQAEMEVKSRIGPTA
jgi:hypothetical protein